MKLFTWNVNGLRARYEEVVQLSEAERPELFGLQEIKASAAQIPEPLTGLPGYFSAWHGGLGGYSGVSLHVRRDAVSRTPSFGHPSFDFESRIVEVELGDLVIASIYVPNGRRSYADKVRFLEALRRRVGEIHDGGRRAILFGDLNVARDPVDVHPALRRRSMLGQSAAERRLFASLLSEGLIDLARWLHPEDSALYTWFPPWDEAREENRGWRLDYFLVSEELAKAATRCEVLGYGTSDHVPVVAHLEAGVPGIT